VGSEPAMRTGSNDPEPAPPPMLLRWFSLVRFSHSIFALPFALMALLLATDGRPSLRLLMLVVAAAVSARTAAMAFNRYVDRHIDAQNPRTQGREIPSGQIRPGAALGVTIAASAIFVLSAWWIAPICLYLSPVVLLVLLGYSYTKRFTWACHLVLGLALGLAPLGAWIAAMGSLEGALGTPLLLAAGVLTWVAGFDVIYSLQDDDFDRGLGLSSIPERFGRRGALLISALLHVLTVGFFVWTGLRAELGLFYWLGVGASAALLAWQHSIVKPQDLSRVNAAFFSANGLLSLVLAGLTAIELWIG
jgi:4-hydroxybenzoate polyprenyltransferase